ncbi:hypothetical protein NM688_g1298 [Phlebia brevispora]|uniref:Uncharacterized protein n=1 Tax=Phlebia brevispora TaxID=194682 RepID=A0ACC1TC52_9APHY|nr:hypothetical protein NM688_g1298 [Phlebia brevispora]
MDSASNTMANPPQEMDWSPPTQDTMFSSISLISMQESSTHVSVTHREEARVLPAVWNELLTSVANRTAQALNSSQFNQLVQTSRTSQSQFDYWVEYCNNNETGKQYIDAILCTMQAMLDELSPDTFDDTRQELRRMLLKLSQNTEVLPKSLFREDAKLDGRLSAHGGYYSDVYSGELEGRKIAFKLLRTELAGLYPEKWRRRSTCLAAAGSRPCTALSRPSGRSPGTELLHAVSVGGEWKLMEVSAQSRPGGFWPKVYMGRLPVICPYLRSRLQLTVAFQILQVAEGLIYLHENKIVHGDLRGPNILLHEDDSILLSDFGLATIGNGELNTHGFSDWKSGGERWMAPEVLQGNRCEVAGDIYSFACVCLEIVTQDAPFSYIQDLKAVIFAMGMGQRLRWPTNADENFAKMGQQKHFEQMGHIVIPAWNDEPTGRPKLEDLRDSLRRDYDEKLVVK